eukprot:TRINITY_DN27694_c0_g1_i1.p1 TRINITY_DN27694_c0_g1~~TRINITY_DN27694_c0_g1_i1.p1  ORF type:complete len:585 (+),score=81.76 TRINITY_DN27694_c0_g1_i1:124-1878(+)
MPAESCAEEEFVDIPDVVDEIRLVGRDAEGVMFEWRVPCDNARPILRYDILVRRWCLGCDCGELPEGDDVVETADTGCRTAVDLLIAVEDCDAREGYCQFRLRQDNVPKHHSNESTPLSSFPQTRLSVDVPPVAAWVSVRAVNCEGLASWAEPTLLLFRGKELAPSAATLHTWGLAEDGRLGRGRAAVDRGVCAESGAVEELNDVCVHAMAMGSHSAIITADDRLMVWGTFLADAETDGSKTEPPRHDDEVQVVMEPVEQPTSFVPHDVACGRFTTVVYSAEGRVFAWGPNDAYQCGTTGPGVIRQLVELKIPRRKQVVQLALGEFHGLGLTADGIVVSWGMEQGPEVITGAGVAIGEENARLAALKLPTRASLNQPEPRVLDMPRRVVKVAAGAYHSALITDDGRLWTWGSNDKRQLGIQDCCEASLASPHPVGGSLRKHGEVSDNDHPRVLHVSLGGWHTAAVDTAGCLFTWGDNGRGQCGQGEAKLVATPLIVTLSTPKATFSRCLGASCGGMFSIFEAVDDETGDPRFFSCGLGKDGCLGFGQACKRMLRPQPMPEPPDGQRWAHIQAGTVHVAGLLATD